MLDKLVIDATPVTSYLFEQKIFVALALIAVLVCVASAQDYDDEGGNQGNDGYGGFSGGGDDDYAAPRERGIVGAEGSDHYPGYHHQGDDSGNENYDGDDSAAAASQVKPTIARPHLMKLIKHSK